jgi:hypothetical protein
MEDRDERRRRLQRAGGSVGGFALHAKYPKEELSAHKRLGIKAVIHKKMPELDALEMSDPGEYARRYEAALHQHMAQLRLRGAQKPPAKKLSVLAWACPTCNEELGLTIPIGMKRELCRSHWIQANLDGLNAVLDEAQTRVAV